jgi:hypothetical protein
MLGSVSRLSVAAALALSLGGGLLMAAGVKVRVQKDKTFDFATARTWAWHPKGAGEVVMAVTADDNPKAMQARFEPVIKSAVEQQLAARKLPMAPAGAEPELRVYYYVLVSTSMSAQYIGQFAPAIPEWGLPPFSGATQAATVIQKGSLLIDVTTTKGDIVWRGVAEGEVHMGRTPAQRDAKLREAIAKLLKKFP